MEQDKLKRVAVIGLPGSGKSTFAIKLGEKLGIPVHHLDKHMFEGRTKRNKEEFLSIKKALVKEEAWVIEGCSLSTLEMRFARADTIIYFRLPRSLCIWRVIKRLFTFDNTIADTGCLNGINWTLVKYIWNFDRNTRDRLQELRERYPKVEFIVFHKAQDPDKFLRRLDADHH